MKEEGLPGKESQGQRWRWWKYVIGSSQGNKASICVCKALLRPSVWVPLYDWRLALWKCPTNNTICCAMLWERKVAEAGVEDPTGEVWEAFAFHLKLGEWAGLKERRCQQRQMGGAKANAQRFAQYWRKPLWCFMEIAEFWWWATLTVPTDAHSLRDTILYQPSEGTDSHARLTFFFKVLKTSHLYH